jgi:hypothetical protein
MTESREMTASTSGPPEGTLPELHTRTEIENGVFGLDAEGWVSWVMFSSGRKPTPSGVPASALLDSISSATELEGSTMAPNVYEPSGTLMAELPLKVAHPPLAREGTLRLPIMKSLAVMLASIERNRSTVVPGLGVLPWLHTRTLLMIELPGVVTPAPVTEVTTRSGPLPTPNSLTRTALLSSNDSTVLLLGSRITPSW